MADFEPGTGLPQPADLPDIKNMSDTSDKTEPKPEPAKPPSKPELPKEIGGAPGPEPTRYGDWQHKGRVTDF